MLFFTFLTCGFASAVANRTLDPLTLSLARDFAVPAATAAMLASAAHLPYALVQPIFGPLGDYFGKGRVVKIALWVLAGVTLASAFAPTFLILVLLRIVGGAASGGVIPATQALVGDHVHPAQRQVMIARFTMSAITGQMVGAAFAGILDGWIGWRGVMICCAIVVALAAAAVTKFVPHSPPARTQPFSVRQAIVNYRTIFRNPRALPCYASTPIVGGLTFGFLPFISPVLESQNNGGVREAGFMIAATAIGALILSTALPYMIRLLSRPMMMVGGAALLALNMFLIALGLPWTIQLLFYAGLGFGFFMQHNSIQYEVSELSQEFRGSAYSMHAFFLFIGQFCGPPAYAGLIAALGTSSALIIAGIAMGATSLTAALAFRMLSRKAAP